MQLRATLVFVLLAGPWASTLAVAQTHPCLQAETSSGQVIEGSAVFAYFCQEVGKGLNGATIRRDGVPVFLSVLEQMTSPTSSGVAQFRVSLGTAPPRGTYRYTATNWNLDGQGTPQESLESLPFALSVVDAPVPRLTAPSKFRVSQ